MLDLESELLKTRKVFLWSDINDAVAKKLILSLKYLSNLSQDAIYLYINSDGGEVEASMAVVDEMVGLCNRGIEVYTIIQGKAYSAAAIIASFGHRGCRYITESSSVFLHSISYGLDSDEVSKQQRSSQFIHDQSESVMRRFAAACGRDGRKFKKFNQDVEKNIWLSAEDAIEFGIVDGSWDFSNEGVVRINV